MATIYICNEPLWTLWNGAPVIINKKLTNPPAMPNMVEIEHALTGDIYVLERSYLTRAKPGMVNAIKEMVRLRKELKQLYKQMAKVLDK